MLLAACETTIPTAVPENLRDDMLPSAEVAAFQRVDARLGYEDARIGYDPDGCAIYEATGPDGRPYAESLRGEDRGPICP